MFSRVNTPFSILHFVAIHIAVGYFSIPWVQAAVPTLSAGYNHALAIDREGHLWSWGSNEFGQLGSTGDKFSLFAQRLVLAEVEDHDKWKQIASGFGTSLASTESGQLWGWGYNAWGTLGKGTSESSSSPVVIAPTTDYQQLSLQWYHLLAIQGNGSLWGWGGNSNYQLGDGTTVDVLTPKTLSNGTWQAVSSGGWHSAAIDNTGKLWLWGDNHFGQLGNNSTQATSQPLLLPGPQTWQVVAAGYEHTLAIASDGSLWAWGQNDYGQLGDGTTLSQLTPALINSGDDWAVLSAGHDHNLAIKRDGTLWSWGDGDEGALGHGDFASSLTPKQIGSDHDWVAVAAGDDYSLALKNDGTLWSWGYNADGELAHGNRTAQNSPVLVITDDGVTPLNLGSSFSLVSDQSGYNLGQIPLEKNASKTLSFRNSGALPITITEATLSQEGQDFSILENGCQNQTLTPEVSCQLTIMLAPTALGTLQTNLQLHYQGHRFSFSQEVTLQGEGLPKNNPPQLTAETFQGESDTPLQAVLSGKDKDRRDILTYSIMAPPVHGEITLIEATGEWNYLPQSGFVGEDRFTAQVYDGLDTSSPVEMIITIIPKNNPPIAIGSTLITAKNAPISGLLSASDADSTDLLTFTLTTLPNHGVVTLDSTGNYTYTPENNFQGEDSFEFTASDGKATSNPATVAITVTRANKIPVVSGGMLKTSPTTPLASNVVGYDEDNDPLTFTKESDPTHGILTFTPDGHFIYTPSADFSGVDQFTFYAQDGLSRSPSATLKIRVVEAPRYTLEGSVTTSQGKGVADIPLALQDSQNLSLATTTDSQGRYRFNNLLPGEYTVIPIGMGQYYFTIPYQNLLLGKNNLSGINFLANPFSFGNP